MSYINKHDLGCPPERPVTIVIFLLWLTACAWTVPATGDTARISQAQTPAIAEIPANGSRITGTVLAISVWPPGSLAGTLPPVRPDRTLHSLRLEIVASSPANPSVSSLARVGEVIEAFTSEPLSASLPGKQVAAIVRLTGTTRGTRWLLSDLRVEGSDAKPD